jgi:ABC-type lipoprotein export system ATPase subunit
MILELKNINKSYRITDSYTQRVLNSVTMDVDKGQRIAIVGPSGSGKSTLLNMIGLLDSPDSGEIIINGNNVSDLSEDQKAGIRNKTIGFIFQSHQLLPQLTVLENILLPTIPLKQSDKNSNLKRANELLDFVGLTEHINKLPGQLSGGERQRVAVVRALINNPDLLIADEPTGSLDQTNAAEIGKLLVKINESQYCSMILVTHSMALAKLIGNIHQLKEGKITDL